QAVRRLSGDPELGEMLVMNYRVAPLEPRRRAMLDFAWKLTTASATIGEEDREGLRRAGLGDEDIFDLAETAASSTCRTEWPAVWISFRTASITGGTGDPHSRGKLTDQACGVSL